MKKYLLILVLCCSLFNVLSAQDILWKSSVLYDYVIYSNVKVDGGNNVYVSYSEFTDFYINKFDEDGNMLWSKTDTSIHYLGNIHAGDDGTLYLVGTKERPSTGPDCYCAVYNSAGIFQYEGYYSISNISQEAPTDLLLDASGNIYISGYASTGNAFDIFTLKMNPGGSISWAQTVNLDPDHVVRTRSMLMNSAGEVYVNGFQNIGSDSIAGVLVKYANNGLHLLTKQYLLNGYWVTIASDIVLDHEQNILFVGIAATPTFEHGYLAKLDPNGEVIWERIFDPVSNSMRLLSADIDNNGNIYVAGQMMVNNNNDAYFAKISPGGDVVWENLYSGTADSPDALGSVIVRGQYCYWAGGTRGIATGYDMLVIKTDLQGNTIWETKYDGAGHDLDILEDFVLDHNDDVIVSGITREEGNGNSYGTVIKYSNSLDVEENNISSAPAPIVFPNPVGQSLCFQYEATSKNPMYRVLDISGKIVEEGIIDNTSYYSVSAENLQAGVYFLVITEKGYSCVTKFVKD